MTTPMFASLRFDWQAGRGETRGCRVGVGFWIALGLVTRYAEVMKLIDLRVIQLTGVAAFTAACFTLAPWLPLHAAEGAGRSEPRVVQPGPPPSDAIVLFDGNDLSQWRGQTGDARWRLEDGAMVVNGTGNLFTREEFGDCQLHIEWATPARVEGEGQGRGNSGVYFQGRYEIQILDSFENPTHPDGQAGAFYGHQPPLVNVSRPPGEWQVYDIIFRAPRKRADGTVQPGSFTVFHNGVLIQDHIPIPGEPTAAAAFGGIVEKGPLMLQDHGNPVRFRNIWLRPLEVPATR